MIVRVIESWDGFPYGAMVDLPDKQAMSAIIQRRAVSIGPIPEAAKETLAEEKAEEPVAKRRRK